MPKHGGWPQRATAGKPLITPLELLKQATQNGSPFRWPPVLRPRPVCHILETRMLKTASTLAAAVLLAHGLVMPQAQAPINFQVF